ncbi:LPS-assembly lipoprotein LptE [Rhodanobacter panaciterrae]|uniref:LPS-assembly lipoprotein LptE n=1 Tax=Rhodanobacter panaciterrae TaxID=490572 RepID=A0ABQ2ZTP9_9GAMM|nr:LPS assembly lipoprotein LptE [Rhodanobacter panaciterrae]GGY24045.1 LPS-assembly lipoprotein LptE [Rhodanobacter panaciterrae]
MSFIKARRLFQASLLLMSVLAVTACGFHLRQSAALPPTLQRIHLNVAGGGEFPRMLSRALETSGVTVEDDSGAGIAELRVPTATFGTDSLTNGGYVRITEYSVHYQVQFDVTGPDGKLLIPLQHINMSREYSYDATNTVGNASQVQEIQHSLNGDMVQAILFRLQAAGKHGLVAPASAASTH